MQHTLGTRRVGRRSPGTRGPCDPRAAPVPPSFPRDPTLCGQSPVSLAETGSFPKFTDPETVLIKPCFGTVVGPTVDDEVEQGWKHGTLLPKQAGAVCGTKVGGTAGVRMIDHPHRFHRLEGFKKKQLISGIEAETLNGGSGEDYRVSAVKIILYIATRANPGVEDHSAALLRIGRVCVAKDLPQDLPVQQRQHPTVGRRLSDCHGYDT